MRQAVLTGLGIIIVSEATTAVESRAGRLVVPDIPDLRLRRMLIQVSIAGRSTKRACHLSRLIKGRSTHGRLTSDTSEATRRAGRRGAGGGGTAAFHADGNRRYLLSHFAAAAGGADNLGGRRRTAYQFLKGASTGWTDVFVDGHTPIPFVRWQRLAQGERALHRQWV